MRRWVRALLVLPLMSIDGPPIFAQDLSRFTRTVDVNGLSFPVLDYGEGSPVLMLHGFPDDRFLWRHQATALAAAGLRVIAPDLRGFGDAPRPIDLAEYGLDIAARDVVGILDALRIGQVQLVGHDWGAALGWRLAAQYPTRVSRSSETPTARTTGRPR